MLNIHRAFIRQSFCMSREAGFLYLANAKSGSSSIKKNLISTVMKKQRQIPSNGFVHGGEYWDTDISPILSGDIYTFSVVRNPFTRILSAYLDKVCKPGILRNQFIQQNGLSPDATLKFKEFLMLLRNPDVVLDQHYRVQAENIYIGGVDFDAIYPLESIDDYWAEIGENLGAKFDGAKQVRHATNALARVAAFYDSESEQLVRDIYKVDFERFGYSVSMDDIAQVPEPRRKISADSEEVKMLQVATTMVGRGDIDEWLNFDVYDETDVQALVTRKALFYRNTLDSHELIHWAKGLLLDESTRLTPSLRYLLLDLIAEHSKGTESLVYLNEMNYIAPYFANANQRAMVISAKAGDIDGAFSKLDALNACTWQGSTFSAQLRKIIAKNQKAGERTLSDLPKITHKLVQFTAIRAAGLKFKDWMKLPQEERDRWLAVARTVLRSERNFFEREGR